MKNQILDDDFTSSNDIRSIDDIKKTLTRIGVTKFYEHQNGRIVVEKGDAVRLEIAYAQSNIQVIPKFPRIGNSMQVIASMVLLAIFLWIIPLLLPFPWIVAIVGGQLISYFFYRPKTVKLKKRIEKFIL